MTCTFCGSEVAAGLKVCPNCGVEVEEAPAASASFANAQQPKSQPQIRIHRSFMPEPEPEQPAKVPGKVLGLVGMIISIVSLVLSFIGCCCCTWVIPVLAVISVVSLVLCIVAAIKAKKADAKNVFAIVGIIVSAVSLVVSVIMLVLWIASIFLNIGMIGIGSLEEILTELEYIFR